MTAGKTALASFVRPQPQIQLHPEVVYFAKAQRGSIRKLREALWLSLPGEAVLHLDFIGSTLLEVVCHEPLVPKMISHFRYMSDGRMRHVAFDPLAWAKISKEILINEKRLWERNTEGCLRRVDRILKGKTWKELRLLFTAIQEKVLELLQ